LTVLPVFFKTTYLMLALDRPSRSSLYHEPAPRAPENLRLMQSIDEQHAAVYQGVQATKA
jgi:hypothetical protein